MSTCNCNQSYKGEVYNLQEQVVKEFDLARKEKGWISSRNDDGIDIGRFSRN